MSASSPPLLHLVTSPHDLSIDAASHSGLGENRPTLRKQLIFDELQRQPASILATHLLPPPPADALTSPSVLYLALRVHLPAYVSFLSRAWSEWQRHCTARTADQYSGAEMSRQGGGDTSVFLPGQCAPRDLASLSGVSTADLTRAGRSIFSEVCYYCVDRLTPIQAHTLSDLHNDLRVIQAAVNLIPPPSSSAPQSHSDTASTSSASSTASASSSSSTSSTSTPTSVHLPTVYALTTQPGHHASTALYGGYCYVNNAAVCAQLLHDKGYGRVGVLDVDYHAGNGTQQLFYQSAHVIVASLHIDPDVDYPYNTGQRGSAREQAGLS